MRFIRSHFAGAGSASVTAPVSAPSSFLRLTLLAACVGLAACSAPPMPQEELPPEPVIVPGYEEVQDGRHYIPPVPAEYLDPVNQRQMVAYAGTERPGTIVVDPYARFLYLVTAPGEAMRYRVAVGRQGRGFSGNAVIGRRAEWPSWTPTANMIRVDPDIYGPYRAGLPGGIENPLGARALYLYRNGRDTMYRIHGTNDVASIGNATSAGCIRLFNQDIIDLYERVGSGQRVRVRSEAESRRLEGPQPAPTVLETLQVPPPETVEVSAVQ
ncbi:L,D-transpeptidase [Halodurantibacterium flavum]|uniref:L,D-transpeptidase n=1 Tax=Halodurantibacterium flavum TaxID=1382802 RepID=A0ABW4S1R4_9RHOB